MAHAEETTLTIPEPNSHIDGSVLRSLLDGRWHEIRTRSRDLARDADLTQRPTDSTDAQRERVLDQMRLLAKSGLNGLGLPVEYGGGGDVGAAVTAFEMLAIGDLSLMVKAGVQWGLFGGAIWHLGNKTHHDEFLPGVIS
ncbi:MAG: acyl-CoA dehydrogenase family protein, partial [Actinobacteria bacterium]|nr:acyl-CoA dehydrogenase family protein [Actinomycetota bacterium]